MTELHRWRAAYADFLEEEQPVELPVKTVDKPIKQLHYERTHSFHSRHPIEVVGTPIRSRRPKWPAWPSEPPRFLGI